MKKLNPVERSQYINNKYKEYLKSSFYLGKSRLQNLFIEQLEKEQLFKGPYVALNFPFQRGKNIESLIEEGIVCESFRNLDDINFTRPLYSHQEEAIRLIGKGRSAIIKTGTGSGKTESFVYPILNDLLFDVEKGNKEVGIRAIFLYPMNTLVNDQIDRIRKILMHCPELTFGFFTGDTIEEASPNTREKLGRKYDVFVPDNELISREEIRKNPPHLLFTNYSMLEYLLIRPNDYAIFEEQKLQNWKYVVLDEAHTYSGSLGIEISLLLRRLTGLAPRRPQFILTSATLGQQGKSEAEIIKFAKSLTSTEYEIDDIVFSKRIPLQETAIYRIAGNDYTAIKDNIKSLEEVKKIADKYYSCHTDNISEVLFELLSKDENVHDLSRILKTQTETFSIIYNKLKDYMSKEDLIALIDIINVAEKNGIGLFDLKYHSFVRPLSGAYITYGEDPKLSLIKTNEIDGMKAFEIGNCRYCNSLYIIGKICRKEDDQMDYLLQNREIDIYENYGNNQHVKIDYFLLENAINEEEVDKDILEEYSICAKCGEIYATDNLNAKKCECGDSYRFTAYRVKQKKDKEDSIYNNISQCPCCGHKGKAGMVRALDIGKDEGTALIAQMLYEAIDEGEEEREKVRKISLGSISKMAQESHESKVKQYLAFSDSRQQASFAAVFFDANHIKMLRRRLIWEMIVQNNYKDMTVDALASYLTEIIKIKDLFQNDMGAHKNAWATILVDLLRVDGAYDGEGLGLYYFDLDIHEALSDLTDEEIGDHFAQYNCRMNKEELNILMQVVLGVFKTTPAVNYVKSTLTSEEKRDILEYRRFDNYVKFKCFKQTNGIKSFLPIKGEENRIVRYVKKIFSCTSEEAKNTLEIVFDILKKVNEIAGSEKLLSENSKGDAYQINASRYVIKNYKTSKFYQCSKCGSLTPYNLRDKCTNDKCTGNLMEVDPDEVLATNFYRGQYKTKKIERIIIQEHTAQLEREKAKQYQKEFKNKNINILSCSTTFEMGIDIGGLETVFMRNVPPTPANYVQRAGRAGRRKDSAAYILTYCGTGSHDYTYFSEPEKMISGRINPPCFNVLNKKIIVRHLMAASLGYFFRLYPELFKSVEALVINRGTEVFKEYIRSHPNDLNEYINKKIIPETQYDSYRDFKWMDEMGGEDEKMAHFVETIFDMLKEYEQAKEQAIKEDRGSDSDYYKKQIELLKKRGVLESLSQYCVIPKYGFPIDVVELQVYKKGRPTSEYNMTRDLKIAISEYAPDSEVITDKTKYTSKYITLKRNNEFTKNWFITCPTCRKTNIFLTKNNNAQCKYCGQDIGREGMEYYIEPINGFKTGETKESTQFKPKRSYAGEVMYLGGGKIDGRRLVIGHSISVETTSDDKLLVMNKSGFYMCPVCGYSDIVKGGFKTPQTLKNHRNFNQYNCSNDILEYLRLGHKFETDVARFTIPMLDSMDKLSFSRALSFLYAFLEGVSIALEIERTDIDGVLELDLDEKSYNVLLYDNVPGGAGHVKRLLNKDAIVSALKVGLGKISKDCCDENTSCYNCLRNYYNQSYHNKLVGKLAMDVIKSLLSEIDGVPASFYSELITKIGSIS